MAKSRHNQRQRKKLHLGEFKELGFEVSGDAARTLDRKEREAFIDAFLTECVEPSGMMFGGGLNENFGGFVCSAERRGSATEEQREIVGRWLAARSELASVVVGPLRDAWYEI